MSEPSSCATRIMNGWPNGGKDPLTMDFSHLIVKEVEIDVQNRVMALADMLSPAKNRTKVDAVEYGIVNQRRIQLLIRKLTRDMAIPEIIAIAKGKYTSFLHYSCTPFYIILMKLVNIFFAISYIIGKRDNHDPLFGFNLWLALMEFLGKLHAWLNSRATSECERILKENSQTVNQHGIKFKMSTLREFVNHLNSNDCVNFYTNTEENLAILLNYIGHIHQGMNRSTWLNDALKLFFRNEGPLALHQFGAVCDVTNKDLRKLGKKKQQGFEDRFKECLLSKGLLLSFNKPRAGSRPPTSTTIKFELSCGVTIYVTFDENFRFQGNLLESEVRAAINVLTHHILSADDRVGTLKFVQKEIQQGVDCK